MILKMNRIEARKMKIKGSEESVQYPSSQDKMISEFNVIYVKI